MIIPIGSTHFDFKSHKFYKIYELNVYIYNGFGWGLVNYEPVNIISVSPVKLK